jgi:hypothetical protein
MISSDGSRSSIVFRNLGTKILGAWELVAPSVLFAGGFRNLHYGLVAEPSEVLFFFEIL